MKGVTLADGKSNLDLLIVTDDYHDFLRKYAFRIIFALQNVYTDYRADIKRMYDARVIPPEVNYSCKKVVFMTWGVEKWTKTKICRWLGLSPVNSINDRYILIMTEDEYGNILPDKSGEKMEEFITNNQLKVNSLNSLDKWWPQMVRFLFNVPMSLNPKHTCYISEMICNNTSLSKKTVKACIAYYDIRQKDSRVSYWKGCNVVLSSIGFPIKTGQTDDGNCVYICDKSLATETTPRQYNKEHMLAGLLRIYSRTGIVKPPLKERIITCGSRTLSYVTWIPRKVTSCMCSKHVQEKLGYILCEHCALTFALDKFLVTRCHGSPVFKCVGCGLEIRRGERYNYTYY